MLPYCLTNTSIENLEPNCEILMLLDNIIHVISNKFVIYTTHKFPNLLVIKILNLALFLLDLLWGEELFDNNLLYTLDNSIGFLFGFLKLLIYNLCPCLPTILIVEVILCTTTPSPIVSGLQRYVAFSASSQIFSSDGLLRTAITGT